MPIHKVEGVLQKIKYVMVSYCLEVKLVGKDLAMRHLAFFPRRNNSRELYIYLVGVTFFSTTGS